MTCLNVVVIGGRCFANYYGHSSYHDTEHFSEHDCALSDAEILAEAAAE